MSRAGMQMAAVLVAVAGWLVLDQVEALAAKPGMTHLRDL